MITEFLDTETVSDHDRFQAWRTQHQDGVVLMLEAGSRGRLHGARCSHFGSGPPYFSSEDGFGSLTAKRKLCGSEAELGEWAINNGIKVKRCQHCARDGLVGADDTEKDLEAQVREAEAVIVGAIPDQQERDLVLRGLARSAAIADSIAPAAWGLTLFTDGFRLNVGPVEVFVLREGTLRVNLSAELGVPPFVEPLFVAATYRSMPEPQCAFVGIIRDYVDVEAATRGAHEAFVRIAASTRSGEARAGTPFRRSHHEGLLEFARRNAQPAASGTPTSQEALPEEISEGSYREGQGIQITVNRYERDASARAACLNHFGSLCQICRVNLSTVYGPIAAGLVHVHHLRPLSQVAGEYEVQPDQDLIPVCPNCHAIVHRHDPPLTPDEVREMISRTGAGKA